MWCDDNIPCPVIVWGHVGERPRSEIIRHVCQTEYSKRKGSWPRLLTLNASQSHQQTLHWLCRIIEFLSSSGEDIDILFHFNVTKIIENTSIYLCSPSIHSINKIEFINCLWWRHQMEAFSASLAICVGNSPVPGEFTTQRPVTRSFEALFDVRLNKRFS